MTRRVQSAVAETEEVGGGGRSKKEKKTACVLTTLPVMLSAKLLCIGQWLVWFFTFHILVFPVIKFDSIFGAELHTHTHAPNPVYVCVCVCEWL